MTSEQVDHLLTSDELAERLGVHVETVRSWIRDGCIPAYRLGRRFTRVRWEEVLAALANDGRRGSPTGRQDRA